MSSSPGWMSVVWLVVVLAAIPLTLWVLKRAGLGSMGALGAQSGVRLVGNLALSPQQRLITVEVGQGAEQRWLLLGVTPQQISLLHQSSTPLAPAPAQPGGPSGPGAAAGWNLSFAQILRRQLPGQTGAEAPAPPVRPPQA
jgi:flagellar protein FliO/FliZ